MIIICKENAIGKHCIDIPTIAYAFWLRNFSSFSTHHRQHIQHLRKTLPTLPPEASNLKQNIDKHMDNIYTLGFFQFLILQSRHC